ALLWPLGIRRKRGGDNRSDEREDGSGDRGEWELDPGKFVAAMGGAAMGFWLWGRMRTMQTSSPAITGGGGGATKPGGTASVTRIPLSDFLALLRAGAVTAVTYLADRPPAGALRMK
ncbi:unnamed protein product, partial [Polarella glacialis]